MAAPVGNFTNPFAYGCHTVSGSTVLSKIYYAAAMLALEHFLLASLISNVHQSLSAPAPLAALRYAQSVFPLLTIHPAACLLISDQGLLRVFL